MGDALSAGWYRDPSGAPVQRYWDGQRWTDAQRPEPKSKVGPWTVGTLAVIGAAAIGWFLWGFFGFSDPDIDELERTTATNMQEYFSREADYKSYHLQVKNLTLVREADNKYTGYADIEPLRGEGRRVSVTVIYTSDGGMWELPPGALAFLAFQGAS